MNSLYLQRYDFQNDRTLGRLYYQGVFVCDTLEDKYRDLATEKKVQNETAIPSGFYQLRLSYSPRFKRILPEILNVPQFTGIRIHNGNTPKDTSGCILVGERDNNIIKNSRATENKVLQLIRENGIDSIDIHCNFPHT